MSVAQRRKRERRERRESILHAAEEVFAGKGFAEATMDDIAAGAELSKGTLYLYFKNKDDLFTALSAQMISKLADDCIQLAASEPDGLSGVRSLLRRYAAFIAANSHHFRIAMGRLASGTLAEPDTENCGEYRDRMSKVMQSFATAIERGKRDGTLQRTLDANQIALQLWGGLIGTMLLVINRDQISRRVPPSINFSSVVEEYIHLVCHGLTPHTAENRP